MMKRIKKELNQIAFFPFLLISYSECDRIASVILCLKKTMKYI